MAHGPELTVIIPSRDALTWLPTAVASIGADPNLEIVVVDDGSRDGTLAWLAERAAADPRLRFLRGEGRGPSRARNLGIRDARAPLVAFLDADDRWAPGKLAPQLALHRARPDIGFSFTDYRHVTTAGEDRGPCFAFWPRFAARARPHREAFVLEDAVAALFAENVVGTSTVIARTDLLRVVGGFSQDLGSAEDWDLWLTLAERAPVGVVPTVLADYLMHRPGNMSDRLSERASAMRMIAARHRERALAQDRGAERGFNARLSAADAELAEARGETLRAMALRLRAWAWQPSLRAAREVVGSLRRRQPAG